MDDLDVMVQIQNVENISETKAMKIIRKFVALQDASSSFHASNQADRTPDEIIEKMKIMIDSSDDYAKIVDKVKTKKKENEKGQLDEDEPDELEALSQKKKKQRKKQRQHK